MNAIRNLSKLANDLTLHNKLTIPGDLEIIGPLKIGTVNIKPNGEIHGGEIHGRDIHSTASLNTKGKLNVSGTIHGTSFTTINKKISDNAGTIKSNAGTIKSNAGTIKSNAGTIKSNAGTMNSNTRTISSNLIKNNMKNVTQDILIKMRR